ncbi:MAG: hypothetical protein WBA39_29335, partial [Rivularia sp. (in: cyanobacteria)]
VSISDDGLLTALNDGVAYLKASRDNISAVTALRVGQIPAPTNQDEFNVVIAEEEGLQLYPEAVTMTPGMTRRLLVGVDESFTPNLNEANNGTRYFVSNPDILEVDANGVITARSSGIADVTVIYNAAEYVVPVNVENPLGSREIGSGGGVIEGSDGSQVLVGPDTLFEDTLVSIEEIQEPENTFSLPIPESEDLQFVKAFRLELGDEALDTPVQLAIPAPANLAEGTEVIFFRESTIPTESGGTEPSWELEEIGVVGADGMIRTQSPPLPGILRTGNRVAVASLRYKFVDIRFELPPDTLNALAGLTLTTAVYTSVAVAAINSVKISLPGSNSLLTRSRQTDAFTPLKQKTQAKIAKTLQAAQEYAKAKGKVIQTVGVSKAVSSVFAAPAFAADIDTSIQGSDLLSGLAGFGATTTIAGAVGGGATSRSALNFSTNLTAVSAVHAMMARNIQTMTLDIFEVPPVGLPEVTKVGVEINSSGIYEVKDIIQKPRLSREVEPQNPPIIESAEFEFIADNETTEPVIFITGSNFLNGTLDLGGKLEDLIVDFTFGGKVYAASAWVEKSEVLPYNRYKIAVKPPEMVPLSEASISLRRPQKLRTGTDPSEFEKVELQSARQVNLSQPEVEYALVARRWSDRIDVVDLANPDLIVNQTLEGSANLLAASIPVGSRTNITGSHRPREVAATKDAGRAYAILDRGAVALLDLIALRQLDTDLDKQGIDSIELPPGAKPESIVIEPRSNYAYIADGTHNLIYILDINPNSSTYHQVETINVDAPNGLRKLAISSDGKKLYGTAPANPQGKIVVVNIDANDKPDNPAANSRKWHKQIAVISTPNFSIEGIEASSDPKKMVFTHRYSERHGFGVLNVENDDPLNFKANADKTTDLKLSYQKLEVNQARDVVITSDNRFAFVLGYNGYQANRGFNLIGENLYSPGTVGKYYGTNIAIIQDPLGDAQVIGTTRPIPMGLGVDLSLTSDDRHLIATYPGINGYFVFDVEEIERTVDVLATNGQTEFKVDRRRQSGQIYSNFFKNLIGLV